MIPGRENLIPFSSQFDDQLAEHLLFHSMLFYSMFSELSNVPCLSVTHLKMSVEASEKESLMAVLFLGQVCFSQD